MEAVEDITTKIGATFFLPEEQKKAQRKALVVLAPVCFEPLLEPGEIKRDRALRGRQLVGRGS